MFKEMSERELMEIEGGGFWKSVGNFFTGVADGFLDWFMAI